MVFVVMPSDDCVHQKALGTEEYVLPHVSTVSTVTIHVFHLLSVAPDEVVR